MLHSAEPRETCLRCRRPANYCWCAHLSPVATRTRVVLLQHPRERDVPIGTARMAHLGLPNSELHVGVDWSASPALERALANPLLPPALLYPGDGARDLALHPPPGPVTLVVVDGTWSQTRKLVRANARLAALPRYAFTPAAPSTYRIRREPAAHCLSTLESLVHVLGILEGAPERFVPLLAPFHAMVDAQLAAEASLHNARQRRLRAAKAPRRPSPITHEAPWTSVLCLAVEASAWPRELGRDDELLQCVVHRPSTGETLELFVAPPHGLAPGTLAQTGLAVEHLAASVSSETFLARWRSFVRPGDALCTWGDYPVERLRAYGAPLPTVCVDLRRVLRAEHGATGSAADTRRRLGADATPLAALGAGRAGLRLADLAEVAARRWGELQPTAAANLPGG